MIASGERMDFSALSRPTADKHSTGGVGDKITLPLAPLVAAFGVAVPQLSRPRARPHRRHARQARVDPGLAGRAVATTRCWRSSTSVGAVVCAAGDGLAPADSKLYALRDVTGTVEAIPLIASSIMSQEDRRGHRRARARREVRLGRLHEGRRARPASSPRTMVALGTDAGVAHRRAAHRHERRSGSRSATRTRCASRSRCSPAAGRPTSSS